MNASENRNLSDLERQAINDPNPLEIVKIEIENQETTVYNFQVEEDHTYFVTESEIWVHNAEGYSVTVKQLLFAKDHPFAVVGIGRPDPLSENISTSAADFSNNAGVAENDKRMGSETNALRHATWQAMISSKYGISIATQAGNAHEENSKALDNHKEGNLYRLKDADQIADLKNNEIGRSIGGQNRGASRRDLAKIALNTFRNDGLFVAVPTKNDIYRVERRQISETQYRQSLNNYSTLDSNGVSRPQIEGRNRLRNRLNNIGGTH